MIGNGLILAHISPFFTQIVTGLIILAAIWLNTRVFARLGQRSASDERAVPMPMSARGQVMTVLRPDPSRRPWASRCRTSTS